MNFKQIILAAVFLLIVFPAGAIFADTGGTKYSPGYKVYSTDRIKDHPEKNNQVKQKSDCEGSSKSMKSDKDCKEQKGCKDMKSWGGPNGNKDCGKKKSSKNCKGKKGCDNKKAWREGKGDKDCGKMKSWSDRKGHKGCGDMQSWGSWKKRVGKTKDSSNPFRMAIDYSEKCNGDRKGDKGCSKMRSWGGHSRDNQCGKMKSWHDFRIQKIRDYENPFRIAIDYSEKCANDRWGDKGYTGMRSWGGHYRDNQCRKMKSWGDCRSDNRCGNMNAWGHHMGMGDMNFDEHREMHMKMMSDYHGDRECKKSGKGGCKKSK